MDRTLYEDGLVHILRMKFHILRIEEPWVDNLVGIVKVDEMPLCGLKS